MNITDEMKVATQWGSHLPALLACIVVTEDPVLELGVGHFSTPHLHALCLAQKRSLVSIEQNQEWYEQFRDYTTMQIGYSHIVINGSYRDGISNSPTRRWGVAFIDNSPGGKARGDLFEALIGISDFVVMHDAQKEAENFQAVEPMLAGLNWYLCTKYFPHTLIASKTRKVPEVLIGM